MRKREGNGETRGRGIKEKSRKRKGRRKERYKGEGGEEAEKQGEVCVWRWGLWERGKRKAMARTAETAQGKKGRTWRVGITTLEG